MRTCSKLILPFIVFFFSATAMAQVPAPVSQPKMPDIGKLFAQSISEQDIELLTSVVRDGLQGKAVDEQRMAPLAQKLEGLAAMLLRDVLAQSLPMLDGLETELKRELRRLNAAKPQ